MYIYIYIYIRVCVCVKIVSLLVVYEKQTNNGIWLVQSFVCGFRTWRDFFPYSPVFGVEIEYILRSNAKNIYFFRGFPWEQIFPIG